MSPRLTIAAAVAVIAASLSLNAVVTGNGWLVAGIGAVACAALAGCLTRLSGLKLGIGVAVLVVIAIMPMFTGPSWYARIGALAIVAVIAACALASRLRWIAALATYLAALLIYLNLVFAGGLSFARVIPTNRSLTLLSRLPSDAFAQFRYQPPITDITAVSFFAAAGIGLIAISVDILAVRLRRPAIAGLPLLALFSVPVASNLKGFGLGESLTFAIGLAGFLVLLASEGRERLRRWGRLVSFRYIQPADEAGPGPDTREIAASARRIGLAAVCLAVLVPVVLPTMQVRDIFGGPANGSGLGGGSNGGPVSPLLRVQTELNQSKAQSVLTYTTTAKDPREQYLQVYALNYSTRNNEWLAPTTGDERVSGDSSPLNLPVSKVPGLAAGVPVNSVTTKITIARSQQGVAYLPAPYAPVKLSSSSALGWQENTSSLTVFSDEQLMTNLHYTIDSLEPKPTNRELETLLSAPTAIMDDYASYTGPYATKLTQLAHRIVNGALTPFDQAEALQDWFLANFKYSLHPGLPNNSSWLYDFLTKNRRGFCQQFAWGFAVLARLLQIPTRIAVGYTAGSYDSKLGKWQVTSHDAHAWPEIYLTGVGWVRMEPTPSGSAGQGTAIVPVYARGKAVGSVEPPAPVLGSSAGPGPQGSGHSSSVPGGPNRFQTVGPTGSSARHAGKPGFPWPVLIPVLLVLLLAYPGTGRIVTRRRRWLAATGDAALANAAWCEMMDDLADYGFPVRPSETPRALVRRIARDADLDDHARDAARRIGTAEERARYAESPRAGAGLRGDVRTVRQALAARGSWSQRLRARLVPPSTLAATARGLQRTGVLFSWLDTSWPSMRQIRRSLAHRSAAGG